MINWGPFLIIPEDRSCYFLIVRECLVSHIEIGCYAVNKPGGGFDKQIQLEEFGVCELRSGLRNFLIYFCFRHFYILNRLLFLNIFRYRRSPGLFTGLKFCAHTGCDIVPVLEL